MKMTREQLYRRIEQAEPGEIAALEAKIAACPWRQGYHIQPVTGLLNDPNGFSFYEGYYHLFYQWFPLGTEHGMKYWYHTRSKNLVTWENVGIAIEPGTPYDSHGAYSGSAIEKDGKLNLIYTGNTRDENWIRHPFQCLAFMDEQNVITKFEHPVISDVPTGYTEHFRDPKVWLHEDVYYGVIGAQRTDETGCTVLYCSEDLKHWQFLGEIGTTLSSFGYMWECPDYLELEGQGVLIFSPQGIPAESDRYQNIYQSGYLIGEPLNLETREFTHGEFEELDRGFDFYAPQTMHSPDGRRIMVAWMGLPDLAYPTDDSGWAHCLTIPRQLSIQGGKLIQQPVPEMAQLRKDQQGIRIQDSLSNESRSFAGFNGIAYELQCEISQNDADLVGIEFRASDTEKTVIQYDRLQRKLILDRSQSGAALSEASGTIRTCTLNEDIDVDAVIKLHMFVDSSSVEIFVNDGQEVFTSRIFPSRDSTDIRFFAHGGKADFRAVMWNV
ncbi:beta-fructofuranosidase [Paenibacillus intestini]|uniref:Sucrose-6-phosphate hydrolase n=1 Tax=Paenibacillus cucumis (ex Kampfer et al. 2016) TaxID=1776858 RepID=A0ABS7KIB4_9BACL|nr:sucrose-6-phosphate hydrolase [Paenibacillus cucumis (ex Kampfer et al. 2016)]MBY0203904.1 sucrose-6-phosphate hydrolase [Paenibacillus cucumis (ex Kampfer et al. 2016)]MDP9698072.1 beta-fructofuranosidase [Paenibacillus intestini]